MGAKSSASPVSTEFSTVTSAPPISKPMWEGEVMSGVPNVS